MVGEWCFAVRNRRRLEDASNPECHVVDDAGFAAELEGLLEQLLVNARVRLRRIFPGARIVKEELVKSGRGLSEIATWRLGRSTANASCNTGRCNQGHKSHSNRHVTSLGLDARVHLT
jgi:hypothetical protein